MLPVASELSIFIFSALMFWAVSILKETFSAVASDIFLTVTKKLIFSFFEALISFDHSVDVDSFLAKIETLNVLLFTTEVVVTVVGAGVVEAGFMYAGGV